MKFAFTVFLAVIGCSACLGATNPVVVLDATHNIVGTNTMPAVYSIAACTAFTVDTTHFLFAKPIDSVVIGVQTNGADAGLVVIPATNGISGLYKVAASSVLAKEGTALPEFASGSRIVIGVLYKPPNDPLGLFLRHAPSEWIGFAKVKSECEQSSAGDVLKAAPEK